MIPPLDRNCRCDRRMRVGELAICTLGGLKVRRTFCQYSVVSRRTWAATVGVVMYGIRRSHADF
jgi:hypothetical protein